MQLIEFVLWSLVKQSSSTHMAIKASAWKSAEPSKKKRFGQYVNIIMSKNCMANFNANDATDVNHSNIKAMYKEKQMSTARAL